MPKCACGNNAERKLVWSDSTKPISGEKVYTDSCLDCLDKNIADLLRDKAKKVDEYDMNNKYLGSHIITY